MEVTSVPSRILYSEGQWDGRDFETMVILTREHVSQGFMASTTMGLLQVIRFQGKFFAVRTVYRQLQEAIDGCRQDLEAGFCSIILRRGSQVEVWAALSGEVPIAPVTEAEWDPLADPHPPLLFRGRPYPQPEPAPSIAQQQEHHRYRGRSPLAATPENLPTSLPDSLFMRSPRSA